jgi:hypothetical protein
MSGGYMLLVRTPGAEGARDTMDIWFAHIPDMQRAVQAVEASARAAPDRKVTVLGTIRHAVLVDQLGVLEGMAKSFDGEPP